jgi:hypothetical protein
MYPLRCLRVPPGVHVPQVEYHWGRGYVGCEILVSLGSDNEL